MDVMSSPSTSSYEVGWICALPHELAAARAMLDVDHGLLKQREVGDDNTYAIGRIHEHNVVIACLPAGIDGTSAAAVVAQNMRRTFPELRIGLLVGIGGGIPDLEKDVDIRLGDVVVSQPAGEHGGVVQYAKGKLQEDRDTGDSVFVRKGSLNKPPLPLLNALSMLQAYHESDESEMGNYLADMLTHKPIMKKKGYALPGADKDHLFSSVRSDDGRYPEINRTLRDDNNPVIHYGNIASGDFVVKNAEVRDSLRNAFGVKCVEMEAAGLQDTFPCLVIRGICDYADSFKNDVWHRYAAATAAAYAKELLLYVASDQVHHGQSIQEVMGHVHSVLLDEVQTSKAILEENRLHFSKDEARQQTTEERDCLRAFKTTSYEQYKNINQDRVPGTCQWVLDHQNFRRWLDTPSGDLLWISADPGCGKSVLAKSLIDHEFAGLEKTTACYYFFKDNEKQNQLAPALCAMLHQLFSLQPQLLRYAIPAWKTNREMIQEEIESMWQILLAAASDETAGKVVCVLDALDECCDEDRKDLATRLCHFYRSVSTTTKRTTLKFLVTSRPYDNVQRWFEDLVSELPQLRLRGEDENDRIREEIDLVIDVRLRALSLEFELSTEHEQRLRQRLRVMEHRTYLWLYLAMDEIRTQYRDSLDPDEEIIQEVPESVENAYEKILQRITDKQKSHARRVLLIIVGARRPLTLDEVNLACNAAEAYEKKSSVVREARVAHFEKRVRDWCGLFVFINHSQLFLIHLTAKDFLLGKLANVELSPRSWKSSLLIEDVDAEMAIICITYLRLGVVNQQHSSNVENKSSFFQYCVQYWRDHLADGNYTENQTQWLNKVVLELHDTTDPRFKTWFPTTWRTRHDYDPPHVQDQHALAMTGLPTLLAQRYKNDEFEVDLPDSHGQTALTWASELGHELVVQVLLDIGADVNMSNTGKYYTALQAASNKGYEHVMEILLRAGADVDAKGGLYGTALMAASAVGHARSVKLLLEAGADIEAKGGMYGTALRAATADEHDLIVEILLSNGADVNAQTDSGSALHTASSCGHERIIKILLNHRADVNAKDASGFSALNAASVYYHGRAVVQLLLDNGADVNATDNLGRSVLHDTLDTLDGHVAVQILLDNGADVNARDERGRSALQIASEARHELLKVVQILLDNGADVNVRDYSGGSALQSAYMRDRMEIVRLLLDHGADARDIERSESSDDDQVYVHKSGSGYGEYTTDDCGSQDANSVRSTVLPMTAPMFGDTEEPLQRRMTQ